MQGALWRGRARRLLERVATVITIACGAATVLGFLGALWWVFDLFSHFRPHYAVLLLLCAIGLAATWRLHVAATAGVLFAVNVALVLPLYIGGPAPAAPNARPIRVLSFNIDYHSTAYDDVADYARRTNADVVFLLEVQPPAAARAKTRLAGYAVVDRSEPGPWGLLALSRVPIRKHQLHRFAGEYPALELDVEHAGVMYTLLAIHPPPPIGGGWSHDRDVVLREVGAWARKQHGHVAIIGDFNATPWAAPMRALLDATGYDSSQRGFGIQATWPSGAGPLGIPIDHCIHSPSLTTVSRAIGGDYGSDHRPLVVELAPRKPD